MSRVTALHLTAPALACVGLLEYGDETAVRSNASSPDADFFRKAIEDMRANDAVWRTR